MGHYQSVEGTLYFSKPISKECLEKLETIIDEDNTINVYIPKYNYWDEQRPDLDFDYRNGVIGIQWNGGCDGKSDMNHHTINAVIKLMQEEFPDFGLIGSMKMYDLENFTDHYFIDMIDNVATKVETVMVRKNCLCETCKNEIERKENV